MEKKEVFRVIYELYAIVDKGRWEEDESTLTCWFYISTLASLRLQSSFLKFIWPEEWVFGLME